jgi:hypothetical protein
LAAPERPLAQGAVANIPDVGEKAVLSGLLAGISVFLHSTDKARLVEFATPRIGPLGKGAVEAQ